MPEAPLTKCWGLKKNISTRPLFIEALKLTIFIKPVLRPPGRIREDKGG